MLMNHSVVIAATNRYILHKELARERKEQPMTHLSFMGELTALLCGVSLVIVLNWAANNHNPVPLLSRLQEDQAGPADHMMEVQ